MTSSKAQMCKSCFAAGGRGSASVDWAEDEGRQLKKLRRPALYPDLSQSVSTPFLLPVPGIQVSWPLLCQTQDAQTFHLQSGVQAPNPLFFQQMSGFLGPSFRHGSLGFQVPFGEEPRVLSPAQWSGKRARMG